MQISRGSIPFVICIMSLFSGLGTNFSPESLDYEFPEFISRDGSTVLPQDGGQFCLPDNDIFQGNLTFNLTLPDPDLLQHNLGESVATVFILENDEGIFILTTIVQLY